MAVLAWWGASLSRLLRLPMREVRPLAGVTASRWIGQGRPASLAAMCRRPAASPPAAALGGPLRCSWAF